MNTMLLNPTQPDAKAANDVALCRAVYAITDLAILNTDLLNIEVLFQGFISGLEVKVYSEGAVVPTRLLYMKTVYLDNATALKKLGELEDKLIELIAEARDNEEVVA